MLKCISDDARKFTTKVYRSVQLQGGAKVFGTTIKTPIEVFRWQLRCAESGGITAFHYFTITI